MERQEIEEYPGGVIVEKTFVGDKLHKEIWYENGEVHRLNGPAIREWSTNGIYTEQWVYLGKIHRVNAPAITVIYPDGRKMFSWWMHGSRHRTDGYAVLNLKGEKIKYWAWYFKGELMARKEIKYICRPLKYQLALQALPQPIYEEIWKQFLAFFMPKNPFESMKYNQYNTRCGLNIKVVMFIKKMVVDGKLHAKGGPALQKYDETGNITEEWYCKNDKFHNKHGPALKIWNSDESYEEYWARNGQWMRSDGKPSYVKWDAAGKIVEQAWAFNGKLLTKNEILAQQKAKN